MQHPPGTWRGGTLYGKRTAQLACPLCGLRASLSGHQIADDGTVTPSVVCPHAPCTFHEFIVLDGWTP